MKPSTEIKFLNPVRISCLTILLLFCFYCVFPQVPEGYYDGTEGLSGDNLKTALHQIVRGHRVREYSEFRDVILPDLDEDPANDQNIILFYKNNSIPKENFASNGQQDFWNREHTWPSSHGFSTSDTAYTDAHNLRPSDYTVNAAKSNKDFGDIEDTPENQVPEAPNNYTDDDYWEPRDEIKGDVARILFYMDTRYESNVLDLDLVDRQSYSGDPELGVLFTLLQWHESDPVDNYERDRHEKIFFYQENRNPFIDHPEWVFDIWGSSSQPNIMFDKQTFNPDFGSVPYESALTQQYVVHGYNLESDILLHCAAPFYLSLDDMTFATEITVPYDAASTVQLDTIFIKFEPQRSDGREYSNNIRHTSQNAPIRSFIVKGKEGEQSTLQIAQVRTLPLGTRVQVSGVVFDAGNNSSNSRLIYDGSAGIVVRSFDPGNESANLEQGDSILVSGGISTYAELLQISESPIVITALQKNATLPRPKEVTISEVGENYESELVVIKNLQFLEAGDVFKGGGSDGNFNISDETGTMVFRIGNSGHPLVGSVIPGAIFDVTGYIGQFNDQYQLSVRNQDDLRLVSDGGQDPELLDLITIAEARTKPEGEFVKIKGVVLGGENNNEFNRVVFDGTAGIVVRSREMNNLSSELRSGDSVLVTGGLFDYNGLLEIEQPPITITLLNQQNTLPKPQEIIVSEISEEYESEYVLLQNLMFDETGTFATGNFTLYNEQGRITMRIGLSTNPLIGKDIPSGFVDVTGYVGQAGDDYMLYVENEVDLVSIPSKVTGLRTNIEVGGLISPNPANKYLHILPKFTGYSGLRLIDLSGRCQLDLASGTDKISISKLPEGLYMLFLKINDQWYQQKVIVSN
jgi:endonuclease I/DNA/RNA endonuclease YhcR with UshA esterase domain